MVRPLFSVGSGKKCDRIEGVTTVRNGMIAVVAPNIRDGKQSALGREQTAVYDSSASLI